MRKFPLLFTESCFSYLQLRIILQLTIIRADSNGSALKAAIGNDLKGKASPILYVIGIATSFFSEWLSIGIYTLVALMWLVPDKRIENHLKK